MSVEGTAIVVVGGSSGIGLATAKEASRRGANVVIGGRDEQKLRAAAAAIDGARWGRVDAARAASLSDFFSDVGPFHHLVIAASGGRGAGQFATLAEDELRSGFEAKFWVQ